MFGLLRKSEMPTAGTALPGRPEPIPTAETHFVNGRPLKGPYPEGLEQAMFGMGCFWGVGAQVLAAAGRLGDRGRLRRRRDAEPDLREVCSGRTGHNEVVLVVYDPAQVALRGRC